jgi:hypothetical protein
MGKVPDNEETLKKCIGSGCPSYDDCMRGKTEGLYCARGKSACEVSRNGCVCGGCPLASEYDLGKMYYCETGVTE